MHKAVKMFKRDGILPVLSSVVARIRSELLRQQHSYPIGFQVEQGTAWLTGPYASIGEGLRVGRRCRIETISNHSGISYNPRLKIGNRVSMNDDIHIGCALSITIGDDVLLASKIFISDHNHGKYSGLDADSPKVLPNERNLNLKPVYIGDNVWIGEMVTILPGVSIGMGSIIGANSVVAKDIPANCIAVGIPARPIKRYNMEKQIWEPYI